ncbi:N(6)-adenine-specific methyltransferase METTL4 [Drosophila eugracilis]|uniref:N(6)-adenine-specific methyltransferase METTL4 n=1 Tax=Drosophila eugracilis TaxID=29029 RepID=UPI001BD9951C|nr:N(6)-adenine-specific methyltransferase METTL4 [Drosophila eugracilis]
MIKLQKKTDDAKFAIFLDHRKLINEAYGEFKIRLGLFQFQVKKTNPEESKSRKRKRKTGEGDASSLEDLKLVNGYLEILNKPLQAGEIPPIERHWEDGYNVPQLHGANESGRMQRFQGQGERHNVYLIPNGARFYNHNVDNLSTLLRQLLPAYDLVVLDPPWRNRYIRRLKRAKQELGYSMMSNDQMSHIPLAKLTHSRSLVAIWCTNSPMHQTALEQQLLPSWKLRLLHKLRWYKLSTDHQLIAPPHADLTQKQPYEVLYIACRSDAPKEYGKDVQEIELFFSVPSIVHSHKPPLLAWLRNHLQLDDGQEEPNCLELFARYLYPRFTSIGLEVLKLMDERLYEVNVEGADSKDQS